MSIYFDPKRNAYIDTESGAIIPVQDGDIRLEETKVAIPKVPGNNIDSDHAFALSLAEVESSVDHSESHTRPNANSSFLQRIMSSLNSNDYTFRSRSHQNINDMQYIQPSGDIPVPTDASEDWLFARALQAMEFEMQEDLGLTPSAQEVDFSNKELKASTCMAQMLTLSTAVVLTQIAVLVAIIQEYGYAPQQVNSLLGPDAQALVNYGAKEAYLIIKRGEWWRCVTAVFLHAGILHILANGAIQLRVGGYLNLVYGNISWVLIYFVSGFFGNMMSCIFSEDSISVGSSGAVLGMLSSWIVWIIFRWNKIPDRAKGNRNCQLFVVIACVVITLATSFSNYVDWAAHYGGAAMGILWGFLLISRELENPRTKFFTRVASIGAISGFLAWAFYEMVNVIDPPLILEPN